jgi:hypothetical protein
LQTGFSLIGNAYRVFPAYRDNGLRIVEDDVGDFQSRTSRQKQNHQNYNDFIHFRPRFFLFCRFSLRRCSFNLAPVDFTYFTFLMIRHGFLPRSLSNRI